MTPFLLLVAFLALVLLGCFLFARACRVNSAQRAAGSAFLILLGVALSVAMCVSGCSRPSSHVAPISPEYDAHQLAGKAKGEVVAVGTLATIGSFEWGTAPLATLAAASLKHVPYLLRGDYLSVDEAQGMINSAVKVRDLLKAANAACAQNGATGRCTGNQTNAQSLADQAKSEIVSGCLSLNDREILDCLHAR